MRRLAMCAIVILVAAGPASASLDDINGYLAAMGANVRLAVVEYYTAWNEAGQTIYFDNRALQLGHHWVPGDPRRGGFWDISWLSDQVDGTANGVTQDETQAAVSSAMATWDGVRNTNIPLIELGDDGEDWGLVQWLFGFGGFPGWYADITHAGWLPGNFFNLVAPGESGDILGVTFTYIWFSGGNPTDIDHNGKLDVAFREIYYNDDFTWAVDGVSDFDVETVALHEAGHGLSQGHFGKHFKTDANGKLHFAPLAVMNAGYTGVQRGLKGTDKAGHSSIWASWPNN